MSQSITFLGAAQTVTGSRHLLEIEGKRILVDCGLFQGSSELRQINRKPFPVPVSSLDMVILTHAHLDHCGFIPKLVADGYTGPIITTPATIGLCRISLPDSGRIQEEDARHAGKRGRLDEAKPIYTEQDAYTSIKLMEPLGYRKVMQLPGGASFRFLPAGHILGSAFAEIYFPNGRRILMSGDLGRFNTPIIVDPQAVDFAEYLVIESTYGDRLHSREDPKEKLLEVIESTFREGGVLLVPSFAIGRTQELLFFISELQREGRLQRIPIFVDSPMAISATSLYLSAKEEHDEDMLLQLSEGLAPLDPEGVQLVRDANASKELNSRSGPMMIISGSGMANGGRIVHHLKRRLSDPTTTVLFTGYQAVGTLGRRLIEGDSPIRIQDAEIDVRARVLSLQSLSAHADYAEMLDWLKMFKTPPERTFLVHGEPPAQAALRQRIESELGWPVEVPAYKDRFELS